MLEEISLQLVHTSSKERTSSHTNKDGKEYVKHHIPGQKNKHLGKRKDKGHRLNKSEHRSGPEQGTSAEYEITNGLITYHHMETIQKEKT